MSNFYSITIVKCFFRYNQDGRKLNAQGQALSPKSPTTQWKDFFMRTFVRRIIVDSSDSSDTPKLSALIDIVDFQPEICPDSLKPSAEKTSQKLPLTKIKVNNNDIKDKNLIPDRPEIAFNFNYNSDESDEDELNASARFGLTARLPLSRQRSARMKEEVISPIIEPCCSICKSTKYIFFFLFHCFTFFIRICQNLKEIFYFICCNTKTLI